MTLLACAGTISASPQRRADYALKERHFVPRSWTRVGPAPSQHKIQLHIGVKQGNFNELERHLYEVSDPFHPRYGQHLSKAEVTGLVKPSDETLAQVHDWLCGNGVTEDQLEYSHAKDWIKVTLPVSTVEDLLDTQYSVFRHRDGSHVVRTPEWSLPMHLHEHIETIQPTNSFFQPRAKRTTLMRLPDVDQSQYSMDPVDTQSKATVDQACNVTNVTPTCLRTLYGTIDYTPKSAGENQIGLTNYLSEANNRSDVNLFLTRFRPEAAGAAFNFTTVIVADGDNQQTPNNSTENAAGKDLEGNLDAETILGITFPTPLTTFNTGGSPPFVPDLLTPTDTNEPYLTWLNYVLALNSTPQVISTSYGDDEQTVPLSFATSVCNGFAQLGARGVTLLFSSGDNGVGPSADCFTNDGKNTSSFLPAFPAGCPYITSVGGTKNISPEIVAFDAANGFSSGGGFSNYFARPSYQDKVVPAYITSLGTQFQGLYNASGRGYPDIAAQGFRFATIWNGNLTFLDGTSASSPTAASVISLVNDALLAAGKPVLGFMNPWLYSVGSTAFTDITNGSAIGCNTTGFPATTGWDPVSGFGTPYFPKLQAAALNDGMFSSDPRNIPMSLCALFVVTLMLCL
ncbi:tripeptidyl peptidase-like protein [Mollisia scopiformis]|uniref:tripeptidyl-peptidase II n=1 Tax=Mollisia scopiformis TaxID=149040 RepID=A0A132B2N6_MOLSC|nr:tripeptidyl peptidase-like protein [Mollisia scopiformis]KUJ06660.1 tripeptidyl peptidase-like protein [Mollisia scopiformis]